MQTGVTILFAGKSEVRNDDVTIAQVESENPP